jgi:hypothetical protein
MSWDVAPLYTAFQAGSDFIAMLQAPPNARAPSVTTMKAVPTWGNSESTLTARTALTT